MIRRCVLVLGKGFYDACCISPVRYRGERSRTSFFASEQLTQGKHAAVFEPGFAEVCHLSEVVVSFSDTDAFMMYC